MRSLKSLIKGIGAAVFAIAMAVALLPTAALADTSRTITINEPDGQVEDHSYEAYQVFKGTLSGNTLSDIEWGDGVDSAALLAALKADTAIGNNFTSATDAPSAAKAMENLTAATDIEQLAKIVGQHLTSVKHSSADATGSKAVTTITVPSDGYYFIKDVTQSLSNGDTYSKFILKVAGDVEVQSKDTTTTSEKYVKEKNDSTDYESDWQKVADYDMGDQVPFKLEGRVAADYDAYSTYYFAFNDTYNKTQFGDPQNVVVKVDETTIDSSLYTIDTTRSNGFDIVISDLKKTAAQAGSRVTVEYTAELLKTANIGATGNVNTSHITFSNDSNQEGHKGTTPDQHVTVFTYKIVANKTDQDGQPLSGAGFTLYKKGTDGGYNEVKEIGAATDRTEFTFEGIDEGDYKLVETTVPAGYNKMADIEFSVVTNADNTTQKLLNLTVNNSTLSATLATGTISTTIQNQHGSTLPSTGGMGTTVLYIAGAAIAAAAAAGIYMLRRHSSNA